MTTRAQSFIKSNRKELVRFVKFAIVGTIGAMVDFGTLYLLHPVLGLDIALANTCSFTVAVISNFVWNRYWTYPDSRSKPVRTQLVQFFAVNVVGWSINTGLLLLLRFPCASLIGNLSLRVPVVLDTEMIYNLGYNLAKSIATVVVLFWNFIVNRLWTYSDVER